MAGVPGRALGPWLLGIVALSFLGLGVLLSQGLRRTPQARPVVVQQAEANAGLAEERGLGDEARAQLQVLRLRNGAGGRA